MTPAPLPARRGVTIIELMVSLTALTVLLALCAGMIKLLLQLDHSSRDAMTMAADQVRLARDFRADAHLSRLASPPTIADDHLSWNLPDETRVDYTVRPHDLLRELHQQGQLRRRELYRRPAGATVRFESSSEAGHPLVSIVIRRDPAGNLTSLNNRIEAEAGRNDRLIARQP